MASLHHPHARWISEGMLPVANYKVSAHALDVIFKLEAEALATALPLRFGLTMPRIVGHFPTELPRLDVHLEQLDRVFLLEDASLLHLEFQAAYLLMDLVRFGQYDLSLYTAYRRLVRTVIIYGPSVTRRPAPFIMPSLHCHPRMVLLGKRSGTRALSRLRALISCGQPLTEADRVDFMFLPLMRHARPAEIVAREAVALARQIPQPEQLRLLGPLLGLSYHYLGEGILNTLMEELMATSTMRELFADILEQGMAQGIEQGIERGKVEGQRDYILRTLTRRLGPVPVALQEALAQVSDLAQLDALFDAALTVERIEDFAALLPARA